MQLFPVQVSEKSFEVSYILLFSISVLTALRSMNPGLTDDQRLSLQLGTLVTVIATFHYRLMLERQENLVVYRYLDWFFTTPLLLIDFCVLYQIKDTAFILKLILYNAVMLVLGFLGEIRVLSMNTSMWIGFIPFVMLFGKMYRRIQADAKNYSKEEQTERTRFFQGFAVLWSLYGFVHVYPDKPTRDVFYNTLDILTKGAFSLYLYYKSW